MSLKRGEKGKGGSNSGRRTAAEASFPACASLGICESDQSGGKAVEGKKKKKNCIKTNQLCLKVRLPPLNKTMLRGEEKRVISHSLIIPMLSIIKKKNHTH